MSLVTPKAGMSMQVVLTTEDKDGKQTHTKVDFELNVAEQRAIAERDAGGPCFRIWITEDEKNAVAFMDWTCYRLKDGRWAVWRKEADIEALRVGGEIQMVNAINNRRINDDVE